MIKIDLYSKEWCDLIFTGRNKSYGAYKLRKYSARRHSRAMLWVFIGIILFFVMPSVVINIALYITAEDDYVPTTHVTMLSRLQKPNMKIKEIKKISLDIPKVPQKADISAIKFTAPVIKKDDEVGESELERSQQSFAQKDKTIPSSKNDTATYAVPEQLVPEMKPDENMVYQTVDNMPEFPGGEMEMMKFLSTHIQYPFWAQRYNMQGETIVQFIVNADGTLSDCRIVKGVGSYLNAEALRVVRSMPKWTPAKKDGKAVKARCVIPIVFRLF